MGWTSSEWLESVDDRVREDTLRSLTALRAERGETFMDVLEIISRYDPEGLLEMGAPPSEYEPEARTIYPRLPQARSIQDVRRIIEEEFRRWFGAERGDHGEEQEDESYRISLPDSDLDAMAAALWHVWRTRPR